MALDPPAKKARTFKDIPTWDEDESEDAGAAAWNLEEEGDEWVDEYADGEEELYETPLERKAAGIKVMKANTAKTKANAKTKPTADTSVATPRNDAQQEWPELEVEQTEQGDAGEDEEEGLDWEGEDFAAAAAAVEASLAGSEEQVEGEEAWDEAEGLDWEGQDANAAATSIDADGAFKSFNAENDQDGFCEEALLADLRADIARVLPGQQFELEPFGSYVTNLGLAKSDEAARSDLDVVLLFHGQQADTIEDKIIRERLVCPTLQRLGNFLRTKRGVSVKAVILKARVPIVTFDTRELSVDISVQQPWGVLNSWHLKDLCSAGWPGRLRALVRLVKLWAQSKSVHTAKDGALSSYGYSMLCVAFLREIGALPAILPKGNKAKGPYLDSDGALQLVLAGCEKKGVGGARTTLWKAPRPLLADSSEEAGCFPAELFAKWLDWMADTMLGFAGKGVQAPAGCGLMPLQRRHIASARPRSQAELLKDIQWSPKFNEHWNPAAKEIFMLIEEPLNGENVGRCVRLQGFVAIREEVGRAREEFARNVNEEGLEPMQAFKSLCELPPQSIRTQLRNGGGTKKTAPGGWGGEDGGWGDAQGVKRPWEAPSHPSDFGGYGAFGAMGGAAANAANKRWREAAAASASATAQKGGLSSAAAFGARLAFGSHGGGYGWGRGGQGGCWG